MIGVSRRPYRLGLDVGSNSLGWFMVWLDPEGQPSGLGPGGVRIYPDGRDPKSKTSNAVDRRVARGARRRRDRYLKRRVKLMALLVANGLMPEDEAARKALETLDPYELRAKALDAALPAHHLGRALFHLNQRRGFLSNRKTEKEEDHKLTERISELKRAMFDCGARTLGQYLWRRRKAGMAVRARPEAGFYPERELYAREFEEIRRAQLPHQTLSAGAWEELRSAIFHQGDLKAVDPGWCLLEDGEQRAPRALPCAQEFRMVQETNNLRILVEGESARRLTAAERQRVLRELRTKNELKLEKLPKLLGLPTGARINLLDENRKTLKGDEITARLKGLFGKKWFDPTFARAEVVRRLIDVEDPIEIERIAQDLWGLDPANAKKLGTISLPQGFVRLSELAISKILPGMEERGLGYAEAVAEIPEYEHHSDFRPNTALSRLPYYGAVLTRHVFGADPTKPVSDEVGHYGRLANPTVHIGLNQLRRVVNALVAAYGKPEEIVIEVARELKLTKEERDQERQRNNDNQKANLRREQQIRDANGIPSAYLLRKLRLWEEQSFGLVRVCPFTGATISFEMAISDETEIEHILPFSKTLDDSMANKVLCLRVANRVKRDRAPFEAFRSNPWVGKYQCLYEEILSRADALPPNKRWRFHPDAMVRFADEQEFLDRQLNETRYLSRIARFYVAHLYSEKSEGRLRVRAIPGKLTALLRGKWGLNPLLLGHNRAADEDIDNRAFKNRNDHRHHAIDAFVIAMTEQKLLKRISDLNSNADRRRLIDAVPEPWPDFSHDEMRQRLDDMVVSHKADHGLELRTQKPPHVTSGKLHDGTAYGLVKEPAREEENNRRYLNRKGAKPKAKKKRMEAPPNLVYRKAFVSINKNEINRIRDIGLRLRVQKHVEVAKAEAVRAGKTWAEKDLAAALKSFADSLDTDEGERAGRRAEIERLLAISPRSPTATRITQLRVILADANLTGNGRKHRKEDLRRAERRLLDENGHKVKTVSDIQSFSHGIRRVRLVEVLDAHYLVPVKNKSGIAYKSYYGGENAFVDIFETSDGKWHGEPMSVFEANQSGARMEWPAKYPMARLVMRVCKGDLIVLDFNGKRTVMAVRQLDAAAGRFKLAAHNEGGPLQDRHEKKKEEYKNDPFRWLMASYSTLKTMKAERVRVDELGRLWRIRPDETSRPPA